MKWDKLVKIVGSEPVFSSAMLMAEEDSQAAIHLQLSRWAKSGKLIQLRRGLYTLPDTYRKVSAHPFVIANRIKRASYVSLQSALAYYGLIPEYTPVTTSVTTERLGKYNTDIGTFIYKGIKKNLFMGYTSIEFDDKQTALIATPEKSLLDLIYLTPQSESWEYLRELRLQNMEILNTEYLLDLAEEIGSRKLTRAANRIITLAKEEQEAYIEI